MTGTEWITAFAERLGVPAPDDDTIETLLELASVAAHASERLAAPLACHLAGVTGTAPADALAAARALAADPPG
ncbi:MAG: DUF6457 domain-containing protein [Acidimicrobiales bacterium]|jgi:hypothetical protein|nr:DUF6457 domain-containing protein [Acidimicrobiales bacterium]